MVRLKSIKTNEIHQNHNQTVINNFNIGKNIIFLSLYI